MDYKEFVCAVEEQMQIRMARGVRVGLHTAVKNNGKERTGLLMEIPGVNISPTIYLEEYYESYMQGNSLEDIVDELIKFYRNIRREESWNCEGLTKFEGVKDRIVFKVVNTEENREFLKEVPHLAFLDLSIVFYVLLDETDEGTATMVIRNSHAQIWRVQTDMLWEIAVRNVKNLLPAEFFTMTYALREILKNADADENTGGYNLLEENPCDRDGMYVLTNRLRSFGAACIAYPGIPEMIGRILMTDYYVLPSSVHEVIIVPFSPELNAAELEEMVRNINRTQVAEEEVLSNRVYFYEKDSGRLRLGTELQTGWVIG